VAITAGMIDDYLVVYFDHVRIVEPVNLQAAFESKRVTTQQRLVYYCSK
jgi:hypothetical protein